MCQFERFGFASCGAILFECVDFADRAHVDDVEKEIDVYASHMEAYVTALKLETKARSNLISLLMQAETQLESDRKDVKLVANVSFFIK